MIRNDSQESQRSNDEKADVQTIEYAHELLPPIDDDEMKKVQRTFSMLVDRTCQHGPTADGNIFEHTFIPKDWYHYLFRSIVPSDVSVKQHLQHELPQEYLPHDGDDGVKYAFKVWDRRTEQITFEQMPSYHKYGMKLLFSGPIQREILHKRIVKKFFAHETERIGKSFDDPKSHKHIAPFVKMYKINLDELAKPNIDDYKTLNEFFYRKLKPDARVIDEPTDPNAIVSAADCRLILFDNIDEATKVWIKGHHFTLHHLFGDQELADEFRGGSIAVFRLAPVDYHRFHSPVTGLIGPKKKSITGTYYTVNPIAIRENLDVLTRNRRTMITIDSESAGKVAFVAIGALLVGSVNFTVNTGKSITKGYELGYFAYGGSTIVVVFKAGMVKWDDDIQKQANDAMETLVQVGNHIGRVRTEDERNQYLATQPKPRENFGTISQLKHLFPVPGILDKPT